MNRHVSKLIVTSYNVNRKIVKCTFATSGKTILFHFIRTYRRTNRDEKYEIAVEKSMRLRQLSAVRILCNIVLYCFKIKK